MEALAFLIFAELVTIPLTALLCRRRLKRKKPISYGTMLAGAFFASVFFVVSSSVYFNGWDVFTLEGWMDDKFFGRGAVFVVLGCITLMCVLPALGVVVYYQMRHKKDEKHVA